jgi:hypothetical protein
LSALILKWCPTRQRSLTNLIPRAADTVVLEAPWPPVESCKVREGWPHRFEGLPDVHYGDAEHLVDELADAGISKWCLTRH